MRLYEPSADVCLVRQLLLRQPGACSIAAKTEPKSSFRVGCVAFAGQFSGRTSHLCGAGLLAPIAKARLPSVCAVGPIGRALASRVHHNCAGKTVGKSAGLRGDPNGHEGSSVQLARLG